MAICKICKDKVDGRTLIYMERSDRYVRAIKDNVCWDCKHRGCRNFPNCDLAGCGYWD